MSMWDEFADVPIGDRPPKFTFNNIGDQIAGRIVFMKVARFPDGTKAPELWIETAAKQQFQVLAGSASLMAQVIEQRPAIGDLISIKYESAQPARIGYSKTFKVVVRHDTAVGSIPGGMGPNSQASPVAPSAPTQPAYVPPAPPQAPAQPAPAPALSDDDLFQGL